MTSITIDDTDPSIQYSPSASAWNENENQSFMNGTLHFTNVPNASASLSFHGDAVAIYGTTAPDHANVQITLDGRSNIYAGGSGGFASSLHTQVLLYYANSLGPQAHILTISSVSQDGAGLFIDVDAITVLSSANSLINNTSTSGHSNPDPGQTPTGTSQPEGAGSSSPGSKTRSLAPVIGGIVGGVVVLALLFAFMFLFFRRRRRSRFSIDKRHIRPPVSPKTPDLPMQGASMMEARSSLSRQDFSIPTYAPPPLPVQSPPSKRETLARHSIAPSYYSDPSYASDLYSLPSSTALVPPLPQTPSSVRLALSTHSSPRGLGPVMMTSPKRPGERPPPLDIE